MDRGRSDPCCAADQPHSGARAAALTCALRLEYLTVGWNVIEGVIAVAAAIAAGSVALLGFGLDSFVESASAAILTWRFRAEHLGRVSQADVEAVEQRARRLVATLGHVEQRFCVVPIGVQITTCEATSMILEVAAWLRNSSVMRSSCTRWDTRYDCRSSAS